MKNQRNTLLCILINLKSCRYILYTTVYIIKGGVSMASLDQYSTMIIIALIVLFSATIFMNIRTIRIHKSSLKLAQYDQLTELPNRSKIQELITEKLATSYKYMYFILIDLDNFKWINDTFGFSSGNELIRQFVSRIQDEIHEEANFSRMEGNLFLIAHTAESYEEAEIYAHNIQTSLLTPFTLKGNPIILTASIGVSVAPTHGTNTWDLLKHAEQALYHVKESGKNFIALYNADTHNKDTERQLGLQFREALSNQEFYLCYQPKVDAMTKQITSVEALVRWQSSKFGFVSPATFIPIAEKNGFIFDLTEWILVEACKQMKKWELSGSPIQKVSVNISAHHFLANTLDQMVTAALNESELSGDRLELEITETSVMENLQMATGTINRLQELGVSVALDDFGTGVSSLTYLKTLPIHTLKIDKSFIDELAQSDRDAALVRMIIELAKIFKLKVVAEGVESIDQLSYFYVPYSVMKFKAIILVSRSYQKRWILLFLT